MTTEIKLKEPARECIPEILLPFTPVHPKPDDPAWMLPIPRIYKLHHGGALTLDMLRWRDEFGRYWTVPKGFFTDGASVPWLMRWLWDNYDERTLRPAIIHDLRYVMHDYFSLWHTIDYQKLADLSLLYGMKLDCPSRAHAYYIAVRLFGRTVYEHIHKEQIMLDWFEMIQQPEYVLDAWMQGVIQKDRAA